jgi:hypothetical protein
LAVDAFAAPMPEASVDEYRDSAPPQHDIGFPSQRSIVQAIPDTVAE